MNLLASPAWAMRPQPGLVGVLGGMGPAATVDFLAKLVAATPARTDQDHVPCVVSSIPQVPDRVAAFRGDGASPLPALVEAGWRLRCAGVGLVVMPCNTAHLWFDPLQAALGLPMLSLIEAALSATRARLGARQRRAPPRIGLLATDATLDARLYERPYERSQEGPYEGLHMREALHRSSGPRGTVQAPAAASWILPSAAVRQDWLMPGIRAVKAGELAQGRALLGKAARHLVEQGAEALVLGCTEIPLVLDERLTLCPTIDATAALAMAARDWSMEQRQPGRGP